MGRLALMLAMVATIGGCAAQNTRLTSLQFNRETIPFPANFQAEAARVIADRGASRSAIRVSAPHPLIGQSAFSPQRWYSCLAGMTAPVTSGTALPTVSEILEEAALREGETPAYDVVLVFHGSPRADVREAYNSPLCRSVRYAPVTGAVPTT